MMYFLAGILAAGLIALITAMRITRNPEFKLQPPNEDGKVTKEMAPDLSRAERRRYAYLYKRAEKRAARH